MEFITNSLTLESIFLLILISIALVPCLVLISFSLRSINVTLTSFFLIFYCAIFYLFNRLFSYCFGVSFNSGSISFVFDYLQFVCVFILFGFLLIFSSFFFRFNNNSIYCLLFFLLFFSLCLVSARDFIGIYVLLECINACVFIVIKISSKDLRATESAMKYYIVNLVSSSVLLLGCFFLYIQWGSLNLDTISLLHRYQCFYSESFYFFDYMGCFIILISFMIKLGVFPFHIWLLSVYLGLFNRSLWLVTCFTKPVLFLVSLTVFNRLFSIGIGLNSVVLLSGIVSLIWASFLILFETRSRFIIGLLGLLSSGFSLIILSTTVYHSFFVFTIYLVTQSINFIFLLFFFSTSSLSSIDGELDLVDDVRSSLPSFDINLFGSIVHILCLLSLIGVPPLMGFLPKYVLIFYLLTHGYFFTLFIVLLASALNALFFLRLLFFVMTPLVIKKPKDNNIKRFDDFMLYSYFSFIFLIIQFFYFFALFYFLYGDCFFFHVFFTYTL